MDGTRTSIGVKVRSLRRARHWTQAELAHRLGISQPYLSQIERGAGSLSAEQFLTILRLFNVGASEFDRHGKIDREAELQNALARLGAVDLQERDDVLPSAHLEDASAAVRETLVSATPRLLTALAPVLVRNADHINLNRLDATLREAGLERRLAWLIENVCDAVTRELPSTRSTSWANRYRRAALVFQTYLESAFARLSRDASVDAPLTDVLDRDIRTKRTRQLLEASRSPISRRWNIITGLQPEDFSRALRSARVGSE